MKTTFRDKKNFILIVSVFASLLLYYLLTRSNPASTLSTDVPVSNLETKPAAPPPQSNAEAPKAALTSAPVVSAEAPAAKTLAIAPEEVDKLRAKAKNALSSAYTAQRAYHAEYNRYTTDLVATGAQPYDKVMNYKLGFINEFTPEQLNGFNDTQSGSENPRRKDTDSFEGEAFEETAEKYSYSEEAKKLNLEEFSSFCQNHCTADDTHFEMLLAIPLDPTHVDVWLVNDRKELTLVHDGTQGVL